MNLRMYFEDMHVDGNIPARRTMVVILLLHTPKQALIAFAFVCGMVSAMMVQGVLFGFLFSFVGLTMDERGAELTTIVSILFILVGIIMLTEAAKFIFKEEDDDKPPPDWLEKVEYLTPRAALSTGFGWLIVSPKQWAFVLASVAVIFTANLQPIASLVNFIIIGVHLLIPRRSLEIQDTFFNWIKNNLRPLLILLFTGFSLFFLIKGISELLA